MFITFIFFAISSFELSEPSYVQSDRYIDIIRSGENIPTKSVDVASVGRAATLGDLYNIRTATFPQISLFSSNLYHDSIYSVDSPYANIDYIRTETQSEKISKLHIQASLAVDVLWGLIPVYSGSAKYLTEEKKTFQSAKASLIYSLRTKTEVLKIFTDSSKSAMDLNILNTTDATHVVVGIDWGADIVMSVEETNTDSSSRSKVEGSFKSHLEKVASAIGDFIGTEFVGENLEKSSTFSIKFNGDVAPDVLPQTFNDSVKFMRQVPDLIGKENDGKGKEMNYILIPISTIRRVMKKKNTEINQIKQFSPSQSDMWDQPPISGSTRQIPPTPPPWWPQWWPWPWSTTPPGNQTTTPLPQTPPGDQTTTTIPPHLTDPPEPDENVLQAIINVYHDVKESDLLIQDVYREIEKWRHLVPDEFSRIAAIRSNFTSAFNDMRENISDAIASGNQRKQLRSMIWNYMNNDDNNNNWTLENTMKILDSFNKTIQKIKTLSVLPNGRFITDNFHEILAKNYLREILVISFNIDFLDVSSAIFNRIMRILKSAEGTPYYFESTSDQKLLVTTYKFGNPVKKLDFSIDKLECLLVKDETGFVSIFEATGYDLINSYGLKGTKNSIIAVEKNKTFYKIDVLTGKIYSTTMESILNNADVTWNLVGSFPKENETIQNSIASNGSNVFFVTKSGILYEFNPKLKGATALGMTKETGNYASIVQFKKFLYIQKNTGFYEFNGTNLNEIRQMDMGVLEDCGLIVIRDKICRIGGNVTSDADAITCYDPATTSWSKYGNLNQAKYRPGIANTNRGPVIIGGQAFKSQSKTEKHWLNSLELYDENSKSFAYLPRNFPRGLTAPQAVTFNC